MLRAACVMMMVMVAGCGVVGGAANVVGGVASTAVGVAQIGVGAVSAVVP